jgi:hypothetical protein
LVLHGPSQPQGSKATAFVADTSDKKRYAVIVWERNVRTDSLNRKRLVDEVQRTSPKYWKVEDIQFGQANTPTSGSLRVKVAFGLPNGSNWYEYGYLFSGKHTYMLFHYSPEATEPVEVGRFVASFKLISPSANAPPTSMTGLLFLWALWGAIVDWRYKRRGGSKPDWNERRPYLIAVGVGLGIMVAGGIWSSDPAGVCAAVIVFLGTLVFPVWEYGRWRIRQKNPVIGTAATERIAENPDLHSLRSVRQERYGDDGTGRWTEFVGAGERRYRRCKVRCCRGCQWSTE